MGGVQLLVRTFLHPNIGSVSIEIARKQVVALDVEEISTTHQDKARWSMCYSKLSVIQCTYLLIKKFYKHNRFCSKSKAQSRAN